MYFTLDSIAGNSIVCGFTFYEWFRNFIIYNLLLCHVKIDTQSRLTFRQVPLLCIGCHRCAAHKKSLVFCLFFKAERENGE